MCERMFSVSGHALTKYRQGVVPVNLKTQLFLKENAHMPDAALFYDLQKIAPKWREVY